MGTGMIRKILLAALLLASGAAHAQLYSKFGPVTGVLKGNVSSPQTSVAASSDIIGLWTGCTGSNFLRGDGTCAAPAGTGVSSITVPAPLTATGCTGGACAITWTTGQTANRILATPDGTTGAVSLRALAAGDIPPINLGSTANGGVSSSSILLGTNGGTSNGFFSVTGPATSLKTFTLPNASATVLTTNAAVTVAQGGTGVATLTNHGVLLGQGTSNVSAVAAMAADTLLQGQGTGADPAAVSVNNCGSSTQALSYSTSTHTFGCQTITAGTGTVTSLTGGTGVTASPSTITTTGSFAIDQTASLTWTGNETFNPASGTPVTAISGGPNFVAKGTATGASNISYLSFSDSGNTRKGYVGDDSGANSDITLSSDLGGVKFLAPLGVSASTGSSYVDMTPLTGTFTMTLSGFSSPPGLTATYYRIGNIVTLVIPGPAVATSNSTSFSTSTLPSPIQSAKTQLIGLSSYACEDNGVIGGSFTCDVSVNGANLTFTKSGSSTGWTSSGQKGIASQTVISYLLN